MMCLFGHKYVAIGSAEMSKEYGGLTKEFFTNVLYRCNKCGEIRTENVNGYWTPEQIKGESK